MGLASPWKEEFGGDAGAPASVVLRHPENENYHNCGS
jgi:hypothetical protein